MAARMTINADQRAALWRRLDFHLYGCVSCEFDVAEFATLRQRLENVAALLDQIGWEKDAAADSFELNLDDSRVVMALARLRAEANEGFEENESDWAYANECLAARDVIDSVLP